MSEDMDRIQMTDDWRGELRQALEEAPEEGTSALVIVASNRGAAEPGEDQDANYWAALGGDRQPLAYLLAGLILKDREFAQLLAAYMEHLAGPAAGAEIGVN